MARGDLHGGQPLEGIEDRSRRNAPRRGMNHFHVRLSVGGSGPALVTSRGNGAAAIGLTPTWRHMRTLPTVARQRPTRSANETRSM